MTEHIDPELEGRLRAGLQRDVEAAVRPFDPQQIVRNARASRTRVVPALLVATTTVIAAAATLFLVSRFLSPNTGANLDSTGILILAVGEQVQSGPASEPLLMAFDQATQFAKAHPQDIGYPWIDPAAHELVLAAASAEGRDLLQAEAADLNVPTRIRDVSHGYGRLQEVQNGIADLRQEGVTDIALIDSTYADERDNRIVVAITRMSHPLLQELATRFGADTLAVLVDPNLPPAGF